MKNLISKFTNWSNPRFKDQRGITGLETAIVLIAFVVVSSVFAFAALSTGLFTTDKAKETIKAGLAEARGTMEMKGSLIASADVTGSGEKGVKQHRTGGRFSGDQGVSTRSHPLTVGVLCLKDRS